MYLFKVSMMTPQKIIFSDILQYHEQVNADASVSESFSHSSIFHLRKNSCGGFHWQNTRNKSLATGQFY